MAEIKLNGKPFADFKTRKMIGHAVADDIDITFEFKVYPKQMKTIFFLQW